MLISMARMQPIDTLRYSFHDTVLLYHKYFHNLLGPSSRGQVDLDPGVSHPNTPGKNDEISSEERTCHEKNHSPEY